MNTWVASLPIAFDLYVPATWSEDRARSRKAGVPERVDVRTKLLIAAGQIRQAREDRIPRPPVVSGGVKSRERGTGDPESVNNHPNRAARRSALNVVPYTNLFWRET
ncbi:MAG: transposase [Bryobacterales bacterium]|nr:transposase [Bryobacterales bacterium]